MCVLSSNFLDHRVAPVTWYSTLPNTAGSCASRSQPPFNLALANRRNNVPEPRLIDRTKHHTRHMKSSSSFVHSLHHASLSDCLHRVSDSHCGQYFVCRPREPDAGCRIDPERQPPRHPPPSCPINERNVYYQSSNMSLNNHACKRVFSFVMILVAICHLVDFRHLASPSRVLREERKTMTQQS